MPGRGQVGQAVTGCAVAALMAALVAAAPPTSKPVSPTPPETTKTDAVEDARLLFRRHEFAAAVERLTRYIDASVGTSRLEEAREMLVNVALAWSGELDRPGQSGQGAKALPDCSADLRTDPGGS